MKGVLLYNLSKEKLTRLRFLLFKLGLEGRVVAPEEYGLPVGALAGLDGLSPVPEASEAPQEDFSEEMLVMCGLSSAQFSGFLNALRQNRCGVSLKAMLTETAEGDADGDQRSLELCRTAPGAAAGTRGPAEGQTCRRGEKKRAQKMIG